jgi:ferric-dicitrate binding protein FerR (iron transport regulator)/predicted negative regulator of RcsB-dependent stress response
MTDRCTAARDWLARQTVGFPVDDHEAAATHAAHVADCPDCATLLRLYQAFGAGSAEALAHAPVPGSAERFVQAAVVAAPAAAGPDLSAALEHRTAPDAEGRFLAAARAQRAPRTARRSRHALALGTALALAAALLLALIAWPEVPGDSPSPAPLVAVPEAGPAMVAQATGLITVDGRVWAGPSAAPLGPGSALVTGSEARLELSDGSDRIIIGADSRLDIAAWGPEHTRLVLAAGSLQASVAPRQADQPFEVLTPQARVVVVGTRFTVLVTELAETIVRTSEGLVRVERGDGSLLGAVSAGQELRVPTPPESTDLASVLPAPSADIPRSSHEQTAFAQTREPPLTAPAAPSVSPLEQARAWLGEGQDDKAIALLQALPADDWQRDALLGDAHRIEGRLDLAEAAYARALERADHPPAHLLADLASVQQAGARGVEAAETWRRYLTEHPSGAELPTAHLAVAQATLEAGESDVAEGHLQAVLEAAATPAQANTALALLGRQLIEQQRWDDAEALFAPRVDQGDGPCAELAMVGLIRVRLAQGHPEDAAALIALYQKRFPAGERAHEIELLQGALPAAKSR